jgi:hypothetical protein
MSVKDRSDRRRETLLTMPGMGQRMSRATFFPMVLLISKMPDYVLRLLQWNI